MTTIDGLQQLRAEFLRLAEAQESTTAHQSSRNRRSLLAAALLACVVVGGAGVLATRGGGASRSAGAPPLHGAGHLQAHGHGSVSRGAKVIGSRGIGGPWSAAHPFPTGKRVSLNAAEAALGRSIPLARDALANPSRMGPVLLVTGGRIHGVRDTFVAVTYPTSHIAIEYERPVPYPDPAANYRGYVAENQQIAGLRHAAYVGSVAGRPALVINLDADSTRRNPASVEFVFENMRIAVIGYQPAAVLLRVANSIATGGR